MKVYKYIYNIKQYKHENNLAKDVNNFVKFNIMLTNKIDDFGLLNLNIYEWLPGMKSYGGDIITYEGNTYLNILANDKFTTGKWDEDKKRIMFDDNSFKLYSDIIRNGDMFISYENPNGIKFKFEEKDKYLEFTTDSKLKELRVFKTYINSSDNVEQPQSNEDWLYYYRIGVSNINTVNDEYGNIAHFGNDMTNGMDLMAYGSGITDISYNSEERTITFSYILNAHLVCNEGLTKNEDKYTCNGSLVFDINNNYGEGIYYQETYKYIKGSELDKLINNQLDDLNFNTYINTYDNINRYKFAFYNYNTNFTEDVKIGDDTLQSTFVKTNGKANIDKEVDYNYNDIYKDDTYMGISFTPIISKDVSIDRGNCSVYEKLLKLSEIKTMEDLENYQNGGFYNIQKIN